MSDRRLKGLYAITDPDLLRGDQLFCGVEQALQGGAKLIQYRDKHASAAERFTRAKQLRRLTQAFDASLIINDDLKLCLLADADGVHLGRSDGDIKHARSLLGPDKILGVTCHHDIDYALKAQGLGADYCAFGRLFPSNTKPEAPGCPLHIISDAKNLAIPTVAIGGISLQNARQIIALESDMIAVIHGLFGQKDIASTARAFADLFESETA